MTLLPAQVAPPSSRANAWSSSSEAKLRLACSLITVATVSAHPEMSYEDHGTITGPGHIAGVSPSTRGPYAFIGIRPLCDLARVVKSGRGHPRGSLAYDHSIPRGPDGARVESWSRDH